MRLVTNMLKYHQSETKQKKRQIVSTHMLIYNKTFVFSFSLLLHFYCIYILCVYSFLCVRIRDSESFEVIATMAIHKRKNVVEN